MALPTSLSLRCPRKLASPRTGRARPGPADRRRNIISLTTAGKRQLRRALIEPEFTRRYWGGVALVSDWRVGSPVCWQDSPDAEPKDLGQRVLEAQPYRRLAYTWHGFQPEHAAYFGWSDEELAARLGERRSRVTFDCAPHGETVRLTVTHDEFSPDSEMHRAISGQLDGSGGWPELLASLKSLLETGEPLPAPAG